MGANRDMSELLVMDEADCIDTPLRDDAFEMSDEQKMGIIEQHFSKIMYVLGLDTNDASLKDTPARVAKMYVKEIFSGLNPANKPEVTLFDNKYGYNKMLIEKDIALYSTCEHHFVPIIGKAHVSYIPGSKVVGLSKINRLVQYYASRPQVQERLTNQIMQGLKEALDTEHVAVLIEATHMCVCSRGVKDAKSKTLTFGFSGKFNRTSYKNNFMMLALRD